MTKIFCNVNSNCHNANKKCHLLFTVPYYLSRARKFYLTSKVGLLVRIVVFLQSGYPINLVICFHEELKELQVCAEKQTQGQGGGGDASPVLASRSVISLGYISQWSEIQWKDCWTKSIEDQIDSDRPVGPKAAIEDQIVHTAFRARRLEAEFRRKREGWEFVKTAREMNGQMEWCWRHHLRAWRRAVISAVKLDEIGLSGQERAKGAKGPRNVNPARAM